MAEILAAAIFLFGYLAISLEHRLFVNKAAVSLFLAITLWVIMALTLPASGIQAAISESTADIFSVVIFLLTAMTLVEILIHYHFFDLIENYLRARNWNTYQLGWALVAVAFFFSAFLDNLTTTIVMIQIARRLFCPKDLLRIAAAVVIAANAGGAFSPVGDVTTIMLWFAHKFTATHILLQGFLPSALLAVSSSWLLLRRLPHVDAQACNPRRQINPFISV